MAEREPTRAGGEDERGALDLAAIANTLGVAPEANPEGAHVTFVLRNEPLNLTLRLTVDRSGRAVSLYLRGATAFLGFVHLGAIDEVLLDKGKHQVAFVAAGAGGRSTLKVERAGVFTLTSGMETDAPPTTGGEPRA